jgi:2-oxo-4-hydroxy-4-carboxy-5-ureidoimidazoline decarboxylase
VFVICLDDFAPEEALDQVLAGIRGRLTSDPEEERVLTAEELRRLARGRLARLVRTFEECSGSAESAQSTESADSSDSDRPDSPYVPV